MWNFSRVLCFAYIILPNIYDRIWKCNYCFKIFRKSIVLYVVYFISDPRQVCIITPSFLQATHLSLPDVPAPPLLPCLNYPRTHLVHYHVLPFNILRTPHLHLCIISFHLLYCLRLVCLTNHLQAFLCR